MALGTLSGRKRENSFSGFSSCDLTIGLGCAPALDNEGFSLFLERVIFLAGGGPAIAALSTSSTPAAAETRAGSDWRKELREDLDGWIPIDIPSRCGRGKLSEHAEELLRTKKLVSILFLSCSLARQNDNGHTHSNRGIPF